MTSELDGPLKPSGNDWRLITSRIHRNRCVPFLGAGASVGGPGAPGLPTGGQLAEAMADECQYPGTDRWDLLRVGQYFRMVRDPHDVREFIRDQLRQPGIQPTPVHSALARLPIPYVVTTNYDDLMERAFRDAGKSPIEAVYERHGDIQDLGPATVTEPLVYKLHGNTQKLHTMIATEDDVIDFLSCLMTEEPPLPQTIKSLFESHSLLFIGYGLRDWNIRVLLRAIRSRPTGGAPDVASFAIQRRPGPDPPGAAKLWEKSVVYWERRESLRCFDMDASDFATDLMEQYDAMVDAARQ